VWHKTTNKSIKIETILNDKVFIEKKWYATGDFIRGYKIKNIAKGNILLYKNGVYKKIYLKSSKNIVKIEEKIQ
jgi:type II secretory pathway component PulC